MTEFKWKDSEKKTASRAFEQARTAELDKVIQSFKADAAKIEDADQLWTLIDQMKNRRYQFEQKYDYRYSILVSVLARLLGEQRISIEDLAGLDGDKLAAVTLKSEFFSSSARSPMNLFQVVPSINGSTMLFRAACSAAGPNHSLNLTLCGGPILGSISFQPKIGPPQSAG